MSGWCRPLFQVEVRAALESRGCAFSSVENVCVPSAGSLESREFVHFAVLSSVEDFPVPSGEST